MNVTKTIEYGVQVEVKVGTFIEVPAWSSFGFTVAACEWDGAQFRVDNRNSPSNGRAVNIHITGRTMQKISGAYRVKVAIEFVTDDEGESTLVEGWVNV